MTWGVFGHDWAADMLKEHIIRGTIRHAYLFSGPQGVGRRTLAIRLAQALNCECPPEPGEVCRICNTCLQIEKMRHPDLSIVQADQVGGVLKVDQVRELQRSLALHPYSARYRVALMLRFQEANINAMNALLKTLEEPAPQVVLILTAETPESLIPTIVSRCEVLRLRPLGVEQVVNGLTNMAEISLHQANILAHLSGGRIGVAYQLYNEPSRLQQREDWIENLTELLSANRSQRFNFASDLSKDKESFRCAVTVWLSFFRDILLRSTGASAPLINLDKEEEINRISRLLEQQDIVAATGVLQRILGILEGPIAINPRLAAEVLMLDLPHLSA